MATNTVITQNLGTVAEPARSAGWTTPPPWTPARHSAGFAEFGAWTELLPGSIREDLWQYRNEIGREPLLTAAEEVELARAIEIGLFAGHLLASGGHRSGDPLLERVRDEGAVAFARMVRANLRLVFDIASKFGSAGLSTLDRIQFGNLGLIHAVEKFDFTQGTKFSTYATWWIKQQIRRGLADTGRTVRVPVHIQDKLAEGQEVPELPTPWCTLDDLATLEDAGLPCFDHLVDDSLASHFDRSDARRLVAASLAVLSAREEFVLRCRFGLDDDEPMTLDEIGRLLGVTRERVRQIQKKAMTRLTELLVGPAGRTADAADGSAGSGSEPAGVVIVERTVRTGREAPVLATGPSPQTAALDGRPQGPVMASV